jgi:hypothetical protein
MREIRGWNNAEAMGRRIVGLFMKVSLALALVLAVVLAIAGTQFGYRLIALLN